MISSWGTESTLRTKASNSLAAWGPSDACRRCGLIMQLSHSDTDSLVERLFQPLDPTIELALDLREVLLLQLVAAHTNIDLEIAWD